MDITLIGQSPTVAVFTETIGVVGCHNGKLECFVCVKCDHVDKVKSLMASDDDVPDVIDAMIAALYDTQGLQTEHIPKCYSTDQVHFSRTTTMCQYGACDPVIFEAAVDTCPECDGECVTADPINVLLFTRSSIVPAVGNNILCIFVYVAIE